MMGPVNLPRRPWIFSNKYDCDATFFIEGQHIEDYEDTVRRMHDEGFEIGNHSWDHPALDLLSKEEVDTQNYPD